MNVLLLLGLRPAPVSNDLSYLPLLLMLGVILVLSVTFLALLVFFLIRYKRRKLLLSQQAELTPRIEQLPQPE